MNRTQTMYSRWVSPNWWSCYLSQKIWYWNLSLVIKTLALEIKYQHLAGAQESTKSYDAIFFIRTDFVNLISWHTYVHYLVWVSACSSQSTYLLEYSQCIITTTSSNETTYRPTVYVGLSVSIIPLISHNMKFLYMKVSLTSQYGIYLCHDSQFQCRYNPMTLAK